MANKIVYKGHNVGETIQVSIMPTATADNSGAIVQYVGATNANYINGYFYKCVSDGGVTPAYSWEKMQVSDGGDGTPHWSGTKAEYEAIKDTLEAGTYVSITDDYDDGLEVVDVVEEDNMNPVTSNAVYDMLNASITDLTADETAVTYEDYTVETLGAHMYQVGRLCWVHIDIRVTYTGEVALDTDGHKDFWSNKFSIPDFDDVSEWNAVPCFGYISNSHRTFEITLNNFGVTGGQKAIAFRIKYSEDEPIHTSDVFNLRCICCFAKA